MPQNGTPVALWSARLRRSVGRAGQGVRSVKNIQKIALAASFAMSLSIFGFTQVSFNEVKANPANGNAMTGLNNSSQALANAGTTVSPDISVWDRSTGFNYIAMNSASAAGS